MLLASSLVNEFTLIFSAFKLLAAAVPGPRPPKPPLAPACPKVLRPAPLPLLPAEWLLTEPAATIKLGRPAACAAAMLDAPMVPMLLAPGVAAKDS